MNGEEAKSVQAPLLQYLQALHVHQDLEGAPSRLADLTNSQQLEGHIQHYPNSDNALYNHNNGELTYLGHQSADIAYSP